MYGKFKNPRDWLENDKKPSPAGTSSESAPGTMIIVARDPNAKYGKEGYVSPGEMVTYSVEFENEGEGIAYGVYITDVIDKNLDDSSLFVYR